ncbi:mas-related G-protein coupled receptor member H-like [Paroedura picta]|uniref:mas-related G-protein coupled receptor member H-like n=1 Tax=Paroedura picta TaxID=143630 RepID=UPI004056C13C
MAARTNVMTATREHFMNLNYTYPSSPKVSENYENVPTSHNPSGNGTEGRFKDNFLAIILIILLLTSIFGAVGNGVVIRLLGFCMKRNPFMTYILNLAVADFGVVILVIPYEIYYITVQVLKTHMLLCLISCMYTASQFLLTIISIDRCVAVFFPIWYRCKRPPHLSPVVCTLIWVLSILLTAVNITLLFLEGYYSKGHIYQFTTNAVLCLPLMTIATVSLFIKIHLKAPQHRRGKLLTTVLVTLFFFLLFGFPYTVISIIFLDDDLANYMVPCAFVLATLNSSVNPIIYFLAGRQSKSRRRESMKMILQKAFKEEEDCSEETERGTQE